MRTIKMMITMPKTMTNMSPNTNHFGLINMTNTIPNTMPMTMPNTNSPKITNQQIISTHLCPFYVPSLSFGGRMLVIFLLGTSHRRGELCYCFVYTL